LVIRFTDHIQIVITSSCNAIANEYTLQFIRASTMSFQSAVIFTSCLVTASNVVASSPSVFASLLAGDCLITH
jgi:hypothetical protein